MLRPSCDEILTTINENESDDEQKFDSKYSVVIAISKRAREIIQGDDTSTDKIIKPVSKSIKEIVSKKVLVKRGSMESAKSEEVETEEDAEENE